MRYLGFVWKKVLSTHKEIFKKLNGLEYVRNEPKDDIKNNPALQFNIRLHKLLRSEKNLRCVGFSRNKFQ